MLLTGEAGTGKTTVLHCMLEVLQRKGYSTAYVFHTLLSSPDVLRIIVNDFGITCPSNERADSLSALRSWLIKRRQAQDCPVVVVEEAQALADRTLDDLRMLLNLEVSGTNLLQIVLAGQSQLETKLRRPSLQQLRQRVMSHCRLANLSFDDTVGYIRARLTQAGASSGVEIFSADSLKEIYQLSNGNPRTINLLCEHSLLRACAAGHPSVSGTDVQQAAKEFEQDSSVMPATEASRVTSLSGAMSVPELGVESRISQRRFDRMSEVAASRLVRTESASCASEPGEQEITVEAATPAVYQDDELSLRQAALFVASQKLAIIDRRRKQMVGNIAEAGRSVLWLHRERQLKFMVGPLQRPTFARRTLAGTASPEAEMPRDAVSIVGNDLESVRVKPGSAKLKALSRYWRGVSELLQRDIHQCLIQWGLERENRESKRSPPVERQTPTGFRMG